jgi:LysR family transcriptional regulator, nod-box dependent transcriptional activator
MNLAQIDLNLLVALDAILDERHLTRAGDRLGLSQPTMSHTLSRLRRLFGDELLVRVGREYYLTPLAAELVEPLRDVLKKIELTIERRPMFNPARDERAFTIAASDYATYLVLQPAIQRIQREAPGVSLEVQPLGRAASARVEAGEIDLAIWPEVLGPDVPHEVLFQDRWVGVVWSKHPDVEETLSMDQYLDLPHVAYGSSLHDITGIADKAMYETHPEARIAVTVESFFLLPFLITNTPLIALVHARLARRLAGMADIKVVQPIFETPTISEAIFWHPRLTTDPAHRWLRAVLSEAAASML